ncbi:hypothetical protein NPIL_451861 [Nephila pilipes]|uniref:Uncharacterized protein n=1 Tax=Nephila pilipes TaxID=299642 RepID=A0A8X6Q2Y0_NEPPI|nr:hypothetical protein NPIL_451861 [Nephila pilipes]
MGWGVDSGDRIEGLQGVASLERAEKVLRESCNKRRQSGCELKALSFELSTEWSTSLRITGQLPSGITSQFNAEMSTALFTKTHCCTTTESDYVSRVNFVLSLRE